MRLTFVDYMIMLSGMIHSDRDFPKVSDEDWYEYLDEIIEQCYYEWCIPTNTIKRKVKSR